MRVVRLMFGCLALALVVGLPLSFFLGLFIAPPVAVALVASGVAATRAPTWRADHPLSRQEIIFRATVMGGVGVVFFWGLVRDRSDNAYIWLALVGVLLFVVAAVLASAALVPPGPLRVRIGRMALLAAWVVCGPGAVLMLFGVLLSFRAAPSGGPNGLAVGVHGLGLALLLATLWFASRREESALSARGGA
jgi:hypothetical protein